MGAKNMNAWLGGWVKKRYPDVKGDLFSCFMVRNSRMGAEHAQLGFMTPYVWMFIGTYEKLRRFVVEENTITSLIQLEYSGFSGATVPICTFTLQKGCCPGYRGGYVRLSDFVGADQQEPRALQALADPDCGWFYRADAMKFEAIPGGPVAYWVGKGCLASFGNKPLSLYAALKMGLSTGDNSRFYRLWWEIDHSEIVMNCTEIEAAGEKWYPCNRGRDYRKWYGGIPSVIDWSNHGSAIIHNFKNGKQASRPQNLNWSFKPCYTWNLITSGKMSMRFLPPGFMFDQAGCMAFPSDKGTGPALMALVNSSVSDFILDLLNPTLNCPPGVMAEIPIANFTGDYLIGEKADGAVSLSKIDWDSREISWDFGRNPLI